MIAGHVLGVCAAPTESDQKTSSWQQRCLDLLPRIRAQVQRCFRHLPAEPREEATAEAIAAALLAYARLVAQGREDRAYVTPLVRYAVAQGRAGRRVGSRMNVRDVLSEYCRRRKG